MGVAKLSNIYMIDGLPMLSPKSANVKYESLADENSGRTDDGVMHINYITPLIRRVEFEMPPMTSEEIRELTLKVQGKEYDLTYFDPIEGVKTSRVYTSTADFDLYSTFMYGGLWRGMKFNAIELVGE